MMVQLAYHDSTVTVPSWFLVCSGGKGLSGFCGVFIELLIFCGVGTLRCGQSCVRMFVFAVLLKSTSEWFAMQEGQEEYAELKPGFF